ncbi:unnamed protein product [Spirodela intermedia]|uniref:Uncharacterized protein n=1 Tax=Spirodela intermedia TaxID=51605 RepID=A0ABN7EA99_SPIIN|nr:unnamed protein product [Spirodela intermedia]
MATACKTPVAAAAAVLLLLIVAVAVAPASASSMTGYSQSGCSGNRRRWGCGACYNLAGYKGGYFFDYSGARWVGSTAGRTAKAPMTPSAGTSAVALLRL